jgi:nucleoside-diphosphate-sugar epimerase
MMGECDTRTRNLLAALGRAQSLPCCLTYVSTTGVYGDWGGAWGDETRPARPLSSRARLRVDAEQTLRRWGACNGVRVSILRAPGIYAAERLPLERLRAGTPALCASEDVYTNHIHADDLAHACVQALWRGRANRCYNVVDDGELKMGDYFDLVATHCGLPPPPRLARAELAERLSATQMSFLRESRRIGNRRLSRELGLRLKYPTVSVGLADVPSSSRKHSCI